MSERDAATSADYGRTRKQRPLEFAALPELRYCERLDNGDCDDTDKCRANGCRWIEQPAAAASRLLAREKPGWLVIHSYTGNVVAEYDTRQEAADVVEWLRKTWPNGPTVEYCRAS